MRKSFEIIVDFVERWNKQDKEREVAGAIMGLEDSIVKLQDSHSFFFSCTDKWAGEMKKYLGGKFPCGHEYKEFGGYNQALSDLLEFLKS